MTKKIVPIPKTLTIFSLAMINIAALGSVKNWPFIAEYGLSSIFFFIVASLVFFFPVCFISAELATGWPEKGGVYAWIREAFGERMGFLGIWLLWVENVAWYPTILSFIAASFAFAFNPALSENIIYNLIVVISLFGISTLINCFGMRISAWVSTIGAVCGTFIPAILIILLGFQWYFTDRPLSITMSLNALFPDLSSWDQLIFFTGILLAFSGMEMSAVHAKDVKHPQKDFPRAIFLSAFLILFLSILGVLSICFVVPQEKISLVGGSLQALSIFLNQYGLNWVTPLIAILISIGTIGSVSTWIIGPSKGLLAAAQSGDLPPYLTKVNTKGVPIRLLMVQFTIVIVLSLFFLLMPSVSSGFWMLTALAAQLYLIMYLLLFAAAIKLRYLKPNILRSFRVPGGKIGIWIVCSIGALSSLFALCMGFVPPSQLGATNTYFYVIFLICGILLGCLAPWFLNQKNKMNLK